MATGAEECEIFLYGRKRIDRRKTYYSENPRGREMIKSPSKHANGT